MSKSFADILTLIHDNNVEMINFKMADANGQYHQVTIPASSFSIDLIQKGVNIDTTSYSCVAANMGDAIFIPDLDSAMVDAGSIISTVVISGQLRYFNAQVNPAVISGSNDKLPLIFSIVALSCGGVGILCALAEFLLCCCCACSAFIPYLGWVTGFVALCVQFGCAFVALACGIAGIVFGVLANKKCKEIGKSNGMSLAGLILGIVAAALALLPYILIALLTIIWIVLIVIIVVLYAIIAMLGCCFAFVIEVL